MWRNMMRSLQALAVPFLSLGVTLYYVYMIWATMGVSFFGGKINELTIDGLIVINDDYSRDWVWLGCNDYGGALYTWFAIMALNDWQLIQQMYGHTIDPIGGKPVATFIFFTGFLVMSYYSILNILIAFIIDAYSQL